jgi:hypothetical protein
LTGRAVTAYGETISWVKKLSGALRRPPPLPKQLDLDLTGARLVDAAGVRAANLPITQGRITDDKPSETVALDGHLIVPGFINAHDHLHLNNIEPPDLGGPFGNSYDWGDAFSARFDEPWFTDAMAVPRRIRYRHGGLKNLLSGATTVLHHDPWDSVLDHPTFPVHVVQRFGWYHTLR